MADADLAGNLIPHEELVRKVVVDEAMRTRAAKTNLSVSVPDADLDSLVNSVEEIRTALLTAGLIKDDNTN